MADRNETSETVSQGINATKEATEALAQTTSTVESELLERIASLREQLADLARQVEAFAQDQLTEARDLAAEVGNAGADVARRAGRRTASAARAVRDDPIPVVVALGVLALLTAFFVARRQEQHEFRPSRR